MIGILSASYILASTAVFFLTVKLSKDLNSTPLTVTDYLLTAFVGLGWPIVLIDLSIDYWKLWRVKTK